MVNGSAESHAAAPPSRGRTAPDGGAAPAPFSATIALSYVTITHTPFTHRIIDSHILHTVSYSHMHTYMHILTHTLLSILYTYMHTRSYTSFTYIHIHFILMLAYLRIVQAYTSARLYLPLHSPPFHLQHTYCAYKCKYIHAHTWARARIHIHKCIHTLSCWN